MQRRSVLKLVGCAAAGLGLRGAWADTYPSQPISMVVPYPPGGGGDTLARLVGDRLQRSLGVNVTILNKPGGDMRIAVDYVRQKPADGYTILTVSTQFTSAPAVNPKLGYDPVKEFTGIARGVDSPLVLVAGASVAAKTFNDLIAYAKANPGRLSVGITGIGSSDHLTIAAIGQKSGASFKIIPFKGSADAMAALIGGQVDLRFDALTSSVPWIQSGKLHPFAVTGNRRTAALPDVPPLTDFVPGLDKTVYIGWVGKAGLPADIVERLNREIVAAIQAPDLKDKLTALSLDPDTSTAKEFSDYLAADYSFWAGVVKQADIKLE